MHIVKFTLGSHYSLDGTIGYKGGSSEPPRTPPGYGPEHAYLPCINFAGGIQLLEVKQATVCMSPRDKTISYTDS